MKSIVMSVLMKEVFFLLDIYPLLFDRPFLQCMDLGFCININSGQNLIQFQNDFLFFISLRIGMQQQ